MHLPQNTAWLRHKLHLNATIKFSQNSCFPTKRKALQKSTFKQESSGVLCTCTSNLMITLYNIISGPLSIICSYLLIISVKLDNQIIRDLLGVEFASASQVTCSIAFNPQASIYNFLCIYVLNMFFPCIFVFSLIIA